MLTEDDGARGHGARLAVHALGVHVVELGSLGKKPIWPCGEFAEFLTSETTERTLSLGTKDSAGQVGDEKVEFIIRDSVKQAFVITFPPS
jgi:hypothetical protein